jgi:hypothetical protein
MLNLAFVPLLGVGTDLWYGLPLVLAISLVYSGTRHEETDQILKGALRTGTWIIGFMVAIFGVLALMSWSA